MIICPIDYSLLWNQGVLVVTTLSTMVVSYGALSDRLEPHLNPAMPDNPAADLIIW